MAGRVTVELCVCALPHMRLSCGRVDGPEPSVPDGTRGMCVCALVLSREPRSMCAHAAR